MIRPSASSVERLLACPGSAHLPQTEYHTADADAGTARHEDVEVATMIGDLEGLPWQVRKMLEPGDVFSTECAMAYDCSDDTARALGHIKWRDYSDLRPFEIPMTLDLVIYGEKRIAVVDYKGFQEVTSAAENAQLATGALAVARAAGRDEITVAIVYLGASWRPADVAVLSVFELDMHAARLREMMTSSDRSLHVGPWCKYCHAFTSKDGQIQCPEQRKLAESAGGGEIAMRVESMIPFASDDDAADAYDLLQRIRVVVKRMSDALYARAAERPIPLRSGKMLGPVSKQGNEKLDGDVVWNTVKELYPGLEDTAVVRTATKSRLTETLKGKRGAVPAVLKEVAKRGGITRKATTAIEEYDVGPRLVTDSDDEPKQLEEASAAPF
jgi:hypothetical protein